jgi:hypothetical protein
MGGNIQKGKGIGIWLQADHFSLLLWFVYPILIDKSLPILCHSSWLNRLNSELYWIVCVCVNAAVATPLSKWVSGVLSNTGFCAGGRRANKLEKADGSESHGMKGRKIDTIQSTLLEHIQTNKLKQITWVVGTVSALIYTLRVRQLANNSTAPNCPQLKGREIRKKERARGGKGNIWFLESGSSSAIWILAPWWFISFLIFLLQFFVRHNIQYYVQER